MAGKRIKKREDSAKGRNKNRGETVPSLVRLKDINFIKFQDLLGLQKAKWLSKLITALDSKLFGIIPAVIEPTLKKWGAKAEAFKVRELSRAHTDADSYRAREIARAQAYALITASEARRTSEEILSSPSAPGLYARTVERIRSFELGHQQNLEETVSLAIQHLLKEPAKEDENKESADEPIGEEWIDRWIDAAKWASATNVRDLWARLLSAKSMVTDKGVSLQLIETLRLVDEPMAHFFPTMGP
jgi:hypothetical protein